MKTVELRTQIKTIEKEIKTLEKKSYTLENKGLKINYPYSVKVIILKNERDTYGKRGSRKLWVSGTSRHSLYKHENGITYYNKCSIELGQGLWYLLNDTQKEKIRDCITSDKNETMNGVRKIVDEVYYKKNRDEIHNIQCQISELKEDLKQLNFYFKVQQEIEESLRIKEKVLTLEQSKKEFDENQKNINGLKNKDLDFTQKNRVEEVNSVIEISITPKVREKEPVTRQLEKISNIVLQILEVDKHYIVDQYVRYGKKPTTIAKQLTEDYKDQLEKEKRLVTYPSEKHGCLCTTYTSPRVLISHIRKVLQENGVLKEKDKKKKRVKPSKSANNTSFNYVSTLRMG